jgi:hypothetical protein
VVIFGAGASYDSFSSLPPETWDRPSLPDRPSLAKELFLPLQEFRGISRNYRRLQPLVPYLEATENVEDVLEEFRVKAETDAECRSQLLAIRYYLREVIASCQRDWTRRTYGVSNYKTLLDQVRGCSRVCFVTFNYDMLMEHALEGIDIPTGTIGEYTSHPKYSLIKLHGSIDWQLWIPKRGNESVRRFNKQPSAQDMIHAAPIIGDRFIIDKSGHTPSRLPATEIWFSLPALAIPVVSKQTFVCPPEHIDALALLIPEVTKIAIVGWRAGERHFLKMLKDGLTKAVPVIAVCENAEARAETYKRMEEAGIPAHFSDAAPGGFTDFVVNRRIEPFLA